MPPSVCVCARTLEPLEPRDQGPGRRDHSADPPSGPRPPSPQGPPKPTTQPTNKLSSRLHRPGPGAKGLQGIGTPPASALQGRGPKGGDPSHGGPRPPCRSRRPAPRPAAPSPPPRCAPASPQRRMAGTRRLPGPSATASRPLRRLRLRLRPLSAARTPARSPGPPGLPPPQPTSQPQTPELGAACGAAA